MKPKREIIPFFIPHLGCPHACVFCNQKKIAGVSTSVRPSDITDKIEQTICNTDIKPEVAFYGGSFTAISMSEQEGFLKAVYPYKDRLSGIRLSTRPDCISEEILTMLKNYGVTTIELGCQSLDDDVLKKSNRGHTEKDVYDAVRLIKSFGFNLILQMMTGLPSDTFGKSVETARKIIALNPNGVRIYPTVVIKDTRLEEMYKNGEYTPPDIPSTVELCAVLIEMFNEANIPIIRLGLNPSEDLSGGSAVGGAYHPALGELCYSRVYRNKTEKLLEGKKLDGTVTLYVKKGKTSMAVGQHRCNITYLQDKFKAEFKIKEREQTEMVEI